jgi:hypothetical protein
MAARFIVWKLNNADPAVASVRYRCLLPLFADEELTADSIVLDGNRVWRSLDEVRALIIVKSFRASDVQMAKQAAAAGVPVFFDLCDNIYAAGYGGSRGEQIRHNFEAIAAVSRAIVTTGSTLRETLQRALPARLAEKLVEHPDPFETPELVRRILSTGTWPNRDRERALAQTQLLRESARSLRRMLKRFTGRQRPRARVDSGQDMQLPQVIWFGSAGNPHSKQGLAALQAILEPLRRAFARTPFRLHVVSDDFNVYKKLIAGNELPTSFEQWTPLGIFDALRRSKLCILPAMQDAFSQAKSANRLILALSQELPVIASSIPAYAQFGDFVTLDDFEGGIPACLTAPEDFTKRVQAFRIAKLPEFTPQCSAHRWLNRLQTGCDPGTPPRTR